MNRLLITTVLGFVIALGASAGASYWMALNPLFQVNSQAMVSDLEAIGNVVFDTLDEVPEAQWNDKLDGIEHIDNYFIEWFDALDYPELVEHQASLLNNNRVLHSLDDGTPVLELLLNHEKLVVEIVPVEGYEKRRWLNGASTVGVVLLIGLLAAILTLAPTAARLNRLRSLAQRYQEGFFQDRNADHSADAIGDLGGSIETMADRVKVLIADNEQLVEDQRDLMRAVAHEFRAPMARMRFALEMHEDTALSREQQVLSDGLDELDHLVTEVLRYARLQRETPDLKLTNISLTESLQRAAQDVQVLRPDIDVQIETPVAHTRINVDPEQWHRAVRNLISNALKYTESVVIVRSEVDGNQVTLHVDDDGPGIAPHERRNILEPFVRLDSSRTRARGGSGLGLAIVNAVLLKHGGSLQIATSPEGGARFSAAVPIQ